MMNVPTNAMTAASAATAASPDPAASSRAPVDWSVIPFEVSCVRCGQNLRGQSEPKCPSCALEFNWAEAVPIEQLICSRCGYHLFGLQEARCPECGTAFTWSEALAAHHRRRQPYFEFHWRDRPLRSFLASYVRALRPRQLWQRVRLEDRAPPGGLAILFAVGLVAFAAVHVATAMLGEVTVSVIDGLLRTGAPGWFPRYWMLGVWELWNQAVHQCLFAGAIYVGASWGALLVLWQSMRSCRIRPIHPFRAVLYAALPLLVLPSIPHAFQLLFELGGRFSWSWRLLSRLEVHFYSALAGVSMTATLLGWLWMLRSIALAYRYHIRMPHAWGVAVTSQIIAAMVTSIAMMWMNVLRHGL